MANLLGSTALSLTPDHVVIIMDGNGRWAEREGLPRPLGHKRGANQVKKIIRRANEISGLKVLTLWGFSTDNWKRPDNEVNALMGLFKSHIEEETGELNAMKVRVTFIGDRMGLPAPLRLVMQNLEELTKGNKGLHLQIALNYGGWDEAVRAVNKLVALGQTVTEDDIRSALDTSGVPDPKFVIRTSGEFRTSGLMPLQVAKAEWLFVNTLFPDYTPDHFERDVLSYGDRKVRHGGVTSVAL